MAEYNEDQLIAAIYNARKAYMFRYAEEPDTLVIYFDLMAVLHKITSHLEGYYSKGDGDLCYMGMRVVPAAKVEKTYVQVFKSIS